MRLSTVSSKGYKFFQWFFTDSRDSQMILAIHESLRCKLELLTRIPRNTWESQEALQQSLQNHYSQSSVKRITERVGNPCSRACITICNDGFWSKLHGHSLGTPFSAAADDATKHTFVALNSPLASTTLCHRGVSYHLHLHHRWKLFCQHLASHFILSYFFFCNTLCDYSIFPLPVAHQFFTRPMCERTESTSANK